MKWSNLLSVRFVTFFLLFIILSIAAISTPWWLPELTPFDSSTGPQGDTMGGFSSPFITLIMALLAFLAFWTQYQTLRDQRREMNRHHFEDRLLLMLNQYRDNCTNICAGDIKGKGATEELAGEFYFILQSVINIFEEKLTDDIKNLIGLNDEQKAKLTLYHTEITKNASTLQDIIIKTAYGVFFQGIHYTPNASEKEERVWLTRLVEKQLENINVVIDVNKHYSEILCCQDEKLEGMTSFSYKPFQGHNSILGCYYRQLYQMISSIANYPSEELSEEEKYSYAKMVRSHLSDYEQFLLYYNSLSDFGAAWNKPLEENNKYAPINMGLIGRFRMIKNLPGNIYWRGICPIDRFKKEIGAWKNINCDFFETPQFLTIKMS